MNSEFIVVCSLNIVPDVLLQSHMASLDFAFYDGERILEQYHHDIFAAERGSRNRERKVGYKVIRVPMKGDKATGEHEDFLSRFVTEVGEACGRPVGVAVAKDSALLVIEDAIIEDALGTVWRVTHDGK